MIDEVVPAIGLILHFRTADQTLACISSLFDEGIRNVVLVDNSEDSGASVALMKHGFGVFKEKGMNITMLAPERNLGFASGVSLGLDHIHATTPGHVLLINSDATLYNGALHIMLQNLDGNSFGIPMVIKGNEKKEASLLSYYQPLLGLILQRPWPGSVPHPSGCCLLIHRDFAVGELFDKDFFFYGEDAMLGFKVAQTGGRVLECKNALIFHSGSASSKNGSMFYEYHMNRAHWLLARKMASNPIQCAAYFAMRCAILPMRTLVRCLRFRSMIPLKGLLYATTDVISGRLRTLTPPVQE